MDIERAREYFQMELDLYTKDMTAKEKEAFINEALAARAN